MLSIRVLVVDDNTDAGESLGMLLRLMGHQVRVADGGAMALELAREFKPQAVFLDIGMPGKDGYQVARELRELLSDQLRLLVSISGWGMDSDFERSRAAGFDHHLVKPASREQFQDVLAGFTAGAQP